MNHFFMFLKISVFNNFCVLTSLPFFEIHKLVEKIKAILIFSVLPNPKFGRIRFFWTRIWIRPSPNLKIKFGFVRPVDYLKLYEFYLMFVKS